MGEMVALSKKYYKDKVVELQSALEAAEKRVEELEKYCDHTGSCLLRNPRHTGGACSCGFDQALSRKAGEE